MAIVPISKKEAELIADAISQYPRLKSFADFLRKWPALESFQFNVDKDCISLVIFPNSDGLPNDS